MNYNQKGVEEFESDHEIIKFPHEKKGQFYFSAISKRGFRFKECTKEE